MITTVMYGNEAIILKEKERLRIGAVQMSNLIAIIRVRKIDRIENERARELIVFIKK